MSNQNNYKGKLEVNSDTRSKKPDKSKKNLKKKSLLCRSS
jgi:hypothetical protein